MIQEKLYIVTGRLYNSNKRFSNTYSHLVTALLSKNINLWNGSVWEEDVKTGKRKLIKRVIN